MGGGVGEGQNAFFKIAMKQYLGRLMVLRGGFRMLYLR